MEYNGLPKVQRFIYGQYGFGKNDLWITETFNHTAS